MEGNPAAPHAGVVTAIHGETAVVRFQRGSMCAHCGACLAVGEKELEMQVENTLHASLGDRVEVSLTGKRVLQASMIVYLIPLALLIVGVAAGSLISDLWATVCGVLGCAISCVILRLIEKKRGTKEKFRPRMTAILAEDDDKNSIQKDEDE